jgi:rhamnosyltransferase
MNDSVCAITITFNPDIGIFEQQLQSLQTQCQVVLVDNGSKAETLTEIERLAEQYGCRLLALETNEGIAAAQNQGVALVERELPNCEYLLFLDHDSIPPAAFVEDLVEEFRNVQRTHPRAGVIGPAIYEPRAETYYGFHVLQGVRYRRVLPAAMDDDLVACTTINSAGTFCPVQVMREVGPFDEGLFIDHVETDWCFRASDRGFELFGTKSVVLEHRMGDDVLSVRLAGKTTTLPYRSPHRHRYLMRNSVQMLRRSYIPLVWKAYCVVKIVVTFVLFGFFAENNAEQRRAIVGGIADGIRGGSGVIPTSGA